MGSKQRKKPSGGPRKGVTAEEREQERLSMVRLRRAGASYHSIAEQMGISVRTVHDQVMAALREMPQGEAALLRELESQKLDYAEVRLQDAIKDGDTKAINTFIRLSESRRKLLGLDMPEQHEVKISREVDSLAEQLASALAEGQALSVEKGEEPDWHE